MPVMKTYNIKTKQSDFSLLTHIATQVWDMDPEIRCTYNFVATSHQASTLSAIYFKLHFHPLTILSLKCSGHLCYYINTTWQQALADQEPLLATI